jgi:hypothetical protein
MRSHHLIFALSWALVTGSLAQAAPLTFDATGDPDFSGYITFDDSLLSTTIDCQSNNAIIALDLTLDAGGMTYTFGMADVDFSGETLIGDPGSGWLIQNGCGVLASQGDFELSFYPAGTGGTSNDGDATIYWDHTSGTPSYRFDPLWVERAAPPPGPLQAIPTLSAWCAALLTLALLVAGLTGMRRRLKV